MKFQVPSRFLVLAAFLMLAAFSLSGCNTMEGIGEDISAGGQGLSNVASDANPGKD